MKIFNYSLYIGTIQTWNIFVYLKKNLEFFDIYYLNRLMHDISNCY